MRRLKGLSLAVIMASGPDVEALAVDTGIDVRVLSKGAKFIGTGVASAEITIRDAETNELLARGKTAGDSGNDHRIMVEAWPRHTPLLSQSAVPASERDPESVSDTNRYAHEAAIVPIRQERLSAAHRSKRGPRGGERLHPSGGRSS